MLVPEDNEWEHGLTALPDGRVVVAIVGTDSRLLRLWP